METTRPAGSTAEPTNGELKAIIESLASKVEAGMTQNTSAIRDLEGKVVEQGRKILEIDRRLTTNERDTKYLKETQADIQGNLLAEVGALAANDKAQTTKLEAIEKETKQQSTKLATIETDTKAQTALLKLADGYWQKAKAWWKWGRFALAALLFAFDVPKAWDSWHMLLHWLKGAL